MVQVVFPSIVAQAAKVVVVALSTLPADTRYVGLTTCIADNVQVFRT